MRHIILLLLLCVNAGYGQILPVPITQSLNGTWAFRTDPNNVGEIQGWQNPEFSTQNWDEMPVPGNWDLRNEYAHYVGKGWYRKTFTVANELKNKTIHLHFEAVYHDRSVWLNGKKLGENHSGFLPFEFEVASLLQFGQSNTLVVCTDNTFRRGAIWNWGGIRRPVMLVANDGIRIVRQQVTPSIDLTTGKGSVSVKVVLQNHSPQHRNINGEVVLSNKDGITKIQPFSATLSANSTQEVVLNTQFAKNETQLWHFDTPHLYQSEVKIAAFNQQHIARFGFRKIEVDNQNYAFKLNGESVRLMGFNLVPDDRTTGNTLPLWRIKEDIDLMKAAGCNMTRLSHLMLPEEVMNYLDERGILVISEIPLWGFDPLADPNKATAKNWLNRLITNQYNHPSVIAWSVGNEIGDYPTTMKYVESAIEYIRKIDPTRLATAVTHTANRPVDFIRFTDIGLINKYGNNLGPVTDLQHKNHPNKVLFYSEYGVGQLAENLDADLNAKSLIDSIRNRAYLVGASLWTFNDYRSSYIGTKELSENRPWGAVDVFRRKKKAFYSFRKEHAPLKEMQVALIGNTAAKVNIVPRTTLDLPAFPMRDYRLVWKLCQADGKILEGGFEKLSHILPNDATFQKAFKWTNTEVFSLNVALLTPQNDAVYDTTLFFAKPLPVKILQVVGARGNQNGTPPNTGMVRVYFEKNQTATAFKIRYGKEGLTQESAPTTENFADVTKLEFQKNYQIAVVGINSVGETISKIQTVNIEETNFPPPAIRHIEAADGGFFVGYATDDDDYLYRLQYTTQPGDYSNAPIIQSTTRGVMFVSHLINGKTYYFKLQRFKDNNAESVWTSEYQVIPDGEILTQNPEIKGVIVQNNEAIVCFEPVPKAIGYVLEYRAKTVIKKKEVLGEWQKMDIPTAQVAYFTVKNLDPKAQYEWKMTTLK